MNIAINGFGRIGRAAFKILLDRSNAGEDINVVAINDLTTPENLAYLLKYDTVYGNYERTVNFKESALVVDEKEIPILAQKDPSLLPWKQMNVDVVLECTGFFTRSEDAKKHIQAGAKKVVLSAPAKDDGFSTQVFGAENIDFSGELISNASCTTNSVAPVMRVLYKFFGIEKAMLTTVHAYTSTQSLVDGPNSKDPRRGRAAAQNIVPTSTGAAKATAKAMPQFEKIFDGVALRVPVICGSISDITAVLKKDVTPEEVNNVFKEAQKDPSLSKILRYTEEPLVSSDIIKSSFSAIVQGDMTRVVGGNLVKIMAWYDNEWGYSNRLVDMATQNA